MGFFKIKCVKFSKEVKLLLDSLLREWIGLCFLASDILYCRKYVHATRERDISLNWPFSQRYLKTCLNHGVINVLPPLESHDSTMDQSFTKDVGSHCSQEEKVTDVSVQNTVTSCSKDLSCSQAEKGNIVSTQNIAVMNTSEDVINKASHILNVDELVGGVSREVCQSLSNRKLNWGEDNQLSPDTVLGPIIVAIQSSTAQSLHSQDSLGTGASTSLKGFRHNRRKRKGKLKKRSMIDICAVAKQRTLEDLERSYRLSCDLETVPHENFVEENVQITHVDHGCKPVLTDDCSDKKYQNNHDAATDEILSGKRKREVKFKFSRCKSKSWDKKFKSSQVVDIKVCLLL